MHLPHDVKRTLIDLLVWVIFAALALWASDNWAFALIGGFIMACEADAAQRGR